MDAETATTGSSRKKTDLETVAGLELRDASMKGLVKGDQMVDVATLEGASVRERQAQRGKKYVHFGANVIVNLLLSGVRTMTITRRIDRRAGTPGVSDASG
jgi:hypothetical protein